MSRLTEGLDTKPAFTCWGWRPMPRGWRYVSFITEPFGDIVERIMHHYDDLKIAEGIR